MFLMWKLCMMIYFEEKNARIAPGVFGYMEV